MEESQIASYLPSAAPEATCSAASSVPDQVSFTVTPVAAFAAFSTGSMSLSSLEASTRRVPSL